jgi:CRP-like cAMP-binding protein
MNLDDLKHIADLKSVEADALARLAAALEKKEFLDGQAVFSEGDLSDAMYFIQKGAIRIEKSTQAAESPRKTLAVLEAGDYFGEMALFEQKPRSATAVAAGSATILCLSRPAFDELHKNSSAAGFNLLFAMIRTSSDRIRRLSSEVVVYDEIGKAIGQTQDLQALCDVILQQLSSAILADWGLLLICSQFSDRLDICAQTGLSLTPEQREAISNGGGFLGLVRSDPRDRGVDNVDDEELFKSRARLGFETPSLLLAMITVGERFLGMIVLGGRERTQFDANNLNLAVGVARQAAQAILNARHREEDQARSRHSRQFVRF